MPSITASRSLSQFRSELLRVASSRLILCRMAGQSGPLVSVCSVIVSKRNGTRRSAQVPSHRSVYKTDSSSPTDCQKKKWLERTVSRVLFPVAVTCYRAMIIPLGPPLPTASSSLTRESRTGRPQTLPYLALLRMGFTELPASPPALVSSYLTLSPLPVCAEAQRGGLLSVALSLGLPPVPVKDHPALWSPDFPPVQMHGPAIIWLSPTTSY